MMGTSLISIFSKLEFTLHLSKNLLELPLCTFAYGPLDLALSGAKGTYEAPLRN